MLVSYYSIALLAAATQATAGFVHGPREPQGHQASSPIATSFPDPNIDPFYNAPRKIGKYANGAIVRSRQVTTAQVVGAIESYQVFYRTTDNFHAATGTVATVWKPVTPASPPKLFSYQTAEDALNLDCTPSWAFVNDSSVLRGNYQIDAVLISWALAQGYYVVNADAEQLKSAWLVGLIEGHGVLDGIRAAINYLHLPKKGTQVALVGYSGGGHSSVWASSLAKSYAPELNIVGAAFGGTPIDLRAAYELLNGSPGAALAGGALLGLANGYPKMNATLNSLSTANGTATAAKLRSRNNCINAVQPAYANYDFNTLYTSDPLKDPVVASVLAEESLLANVSKIPVPVPKFPRYEWHGTGDKTVPFAPEAQYVEQQCAKCADIRFVSLPGLDHGPAAVAGLPGALGFVQQAFGGTLVPITCGTNVTVPLVGSLEAIEILGTSIDTLLAAALAAMV